MVVIDARWVRKWKKLADGKKKVKSRLCARGCLDRQKDLLTTRSTTATRLSQRLLLSLAATFDMEVEVLGSSSKYGFQAAVSFSKRILSPRRLVGPGRLVASGSVQRGTVWEWDPKRGRVGQDVGQYQWGCFLAPNKNPTGLILPSFQRNSWLCLLKGV